MKRDLIFISVVFSFLLVLSAVFSSAETIEMLLSKGKMSIENGKYEESVNYLGEILTASGNETDDPEITAFGATVQAYGLLKMNNPQMRLMAKQYLETAIKKDPKWGFPKQLLKSLHE